MSDLKKVKVDNWGIFFLQRLKHFFNRTDYCDLTLQFQDNAQLKVHRLVLNACTEYFEILERTCEMYEDCLIMPDDLQTDVMVPIINFMYTGQLEYSNDMLEKLYQTSRIMDMSVLTKLLDAQRQQLQETMQTQNLPVPYFQKRSYTKAFNNTTQKVYTPAKKPLLPPITRNGRQSYTPIAPVKSNVVFEKRPTRYEVPEELDADNIFENSFSNISYETKPLMVHPETKKQYERKKNTSFGIFCEASGSKYDSMMNGPSTSTLDLAECRRIENNDSLYDDECISSFDQSSHATQKDSNILFDQILEDGPKVTIETKDNPCPEKLDHAKIISEVLKKYPHLVKGNKNIRLKIVPPSKASALAKSVLKKRPIEKKIKLEEEDIGMGYTYESDVLDSKEAAKLIALGAENIKGPWICLICGTPGKALYFTSYYKFRRHLVEIHKEKPIISMCEYCGLKSGKRNYLLHHLYTQHGIPPPPTHNFPKCKQCNYVALTEAFLVKHKLAHTEGKEFKCNVCNKHFKSTTMLLNHIQTSGHKICPDRKSVFQCIYCLKTFLRENNLYAHLKTCHKDEVREDGIIECSDEDEPFSGQMNKHISKKLSSFQSDPLSFDQDDFDDISNQDQEFQQLPKNMFRHKQKILNQEFKSKQDNKTTRNLNSNIQNVAESIAQDIIKQFCGDDADVHQKKRSPSKEDTVASNVTENASSTQLNIMEQTQANTAESQPRMVIKKSGNVNQPIQIVVSNEEEYKALIANHPIIFDENNDGKTLAVLSTPHTNVTTATTIDLNNAQSNEMVIIPNEYPINVSEAVPSDNSNIVVVYSHPVNEQNKQYIVDTQYHTQQHIITSQDVGTRFIESSAVITPSYETITSSTPIVSGQILVQTPAMSWPQNVDSNVVTQISSDQQYVVSEEQHKTSSEVTIPVDEKNIINVQSSEFHQTDEIATNEIVVSKAADDNALLIMPDDLPVITNVTEKEVSTSDVIMESMEEELPSIVIPGVEIQHMEQVLSNETEINEEESCITNEQVHDDKTEIAETKDKVIEENVDNSSVEWSEAENDPSKDVVKEDSTIETNSLDNDTDDMEETIENIEREIEKGNKASKGNVNIKTTHKDVQEDETNTEDEPTPSVHVNLKEKITSLLNDWDENESHNGDTSVNDSDVVNKTIIKDKEMSVVLEEEGAEETAEESEEIMAGVVENVPGTEQRSSHKDVGKPDIKKLVSDWEEDDEL